MYKVITWSGQNSKQVYSGSYIECITWMAINANSLKNVCSRELVWENPPAVLTYIGPNIVEKPESMVFSF